MRPESQDKKEKFEREKVKVYGPMRYFMLIVMNKVYGFMVLRY